MANIFTEAEVAPAKPAKAHLFTAFHFVRAPDGRYDYDVIRVAARTHEEAKAAINECKTVDRVGDIYLQTDASIAKCEEHGSSTAIHVSHRTYPTLHYRPTEAEHAGWLAARAFDRYDEDGNHVPADFARIEDAK